MTTIRLLFHVHTRSSFDGVMSPRSIVSFCTRRGIEALAIADHDTDAALDLAGEHARRAGILLVPAVEYHSIDGDIVGLFCRGPMGKRSANDSIEHIQRQGGLAVLVHPAKGHNLDNIDVSRADLIEVFNARCDARANDFAARLAEQHHKPGIAGADAHLPWDLGTCVNELTVASGADGISEASVREALRRGPRPIIRHASPFLSIPMSQMVKAVKQRRPKLFVRQFLSLGKHYLLEPLRRRGAHE